MLTVSTPYLNVQAIRRMYRDQGKPTIAKPGWYALVVNLTGTAVGEERRDVLDIDTDSDFLLLSVYHYYQNGAYNPDLGSVAANAESGQFIADNALDIQSNLIAIRLTPLSSNRPMHNIPFISNAGCDFPQWVGHSNGFSGDWEVGRFPLLAHPREGEDTLTGQDGGISVWRGWLTEPMILPARSEFQVGVKRRAAVATIPLKGNLFVFWGVRLYT